MRIAQRFNAGFEVWLYQVPKGRLNLRSVGRPFGTYAFGRRYPALKRWAIFRRPSGTEIRFGQILVALGVSPAARSPDASPTPSPIHHPSLAAALVSRRHIRSFPLPLRKDP